MERVPRERGMVWKAVDWRRITDVCVALGMLVFLSPLFLVLLTINWLWTGRPFFRQTRLGRDLHPFMVLKFQTMRTGAEKGSSVTVSGDSRITSYGRLLRALKLDEVPQLLNVMRGEMTLVGPRPLTPNEVNAMPAHLASVVYRVRPGLTGVGALAFADEESMLRQFAEPTLAYFQDILPRKVALELAYVQRRTWWTDFLIALLTPVAPFSASVRQRLVLRLVPDWEGVAHAHDSGKS